jgi:hypothetical protein
MDLAVWVMSLRYSRSGGWVGNAALVNQHGAWNKVAQEMLLG